MPINARHGRSIRISTFLAGTLLSFGISGPGQTAGSPAPPGGDWKQIEDAMGRPGQTQPGDVIKFGMPRKDLHIALDKVTIKPSLALGSWVAFKRNGDAAMVMGDLVLAEDEVEPVMMKLQETGIQESALHNHLIGESPRVLYMHIVGHGDGVQMARAIHDALLLTKTPAPDSAPGNQSAVNLGFDQKQIEQILGHSGKVNGGVLQIGIPRAEGITDSGMTVPPSMGVATALNFQPTDNGKAAITGDFVSACNRGESGHQSAANKWHCSNCTAQPHADGRTSLVFHAFLGQRRRSKARKGPARRTGQHQFGKRALVSI